MIIHKYGKAFKIYPDKMQISFVILKIIKCKSLCDNYYNFGTQMRSRKCKKHTHVFIGSLDYENNCVQPFDRTPNY